MTSQNGQSYGPFERIVSGTNPVIDLSNEAQNVLPLNRIYIEANTLGQSMGWEGNPPYVCVGEFFYEEFEEPPINPFTGGCEVLVTGFENNNYTDGQTNTWTFDFRVRFPFANGLVEDDVSFEWVINEFGEGIVVNYPGQPERILTLNLASSSWSGGEEFVGTAQGQFESVAVSGDAVQVEVGAGDFEYEWGNGNISSFNCQPGPTLYTIP